MERRTHQHDACGRVKQPVHELVELVEADAHRGAAQRDAAESLVDVLDVLCDQIARLLHQRQRGTHLLHAPVHEVVQHLQRPIRLLEQDIGTHLLNSPRCVVAGEEAKVAVLVGCGGGRGAV